MYAPEALATRLRSGGTSFTAWCGLRDPYIAALLAREDFDAVVLDMQHGMVDVAAASVAIPIVAGAGKPCLVRVPVDDFATASRVLDWGAAGVIAPMVNTVADARRLAAFTKFPPVGERSWGPMAAMALTGLPADSYFAQANGFSVTLAMIETKQALDALDDILGVEGLDGVFIGPSDLSIGLSGGASMDPMGEAVDRALARVLAACRAAGKLATIFGHTPDRARELAAMGFSLVAVGTDGFLLRSGAQAALKVARA